MLQYLRNLINTYRFVIKLLIIILCSICIFKSDRFQELVSPSYYWQRRVEELEKKISQDQRKITCLHLHLQKQQLIEDLDVAEAKIQAQSNGEDPQNCIVKVQNAKKLKMEQLQEEIEVLLSQEKLKLEQLKIALEKLEQYQ